MTNVIKQIKAGRDLSRRATERARNAGDMESVMYWYGHANGLDLAIATISDALAVSGVVIDGLLADLKGGGP